MVPRCRGSTVVPRDTTVHNGLLVVQSRHLASFSDLFGQQDCVSDLILIVHFHSYLLILFVHYFTSRVKYTYGTPTKFPELFRLQQASAELPLRPLDGSHVFFYGYFICQPLLTAYSVNTSFIDCSYSVWVFRN